RGLGRATGGRRAEDRRQERRRAAALQSAGTAPRRAGRSARWLSELKRAAGAFGDFVPGAGGGEAAVGEPGSADGRDEREGQVSGEVCFVDASKRNDPQRRVTVR